VQLLKLVIVLNIASTCLRFGRVDLFDRKHAHVLF